MKYLIKTAVFNAISIYAFGLIFPGVIRFSNLKILLLASLIFGLLNIFVKPILKILSLPLNLVTFGLFNTLINVFIIYLVTVFVPEFQITAFVLQSFSFLGLSVPSIQFSLILAYLFVSAFLGVISSFVWLFLG